MTRYDYTDPEGNTFEIALSLLGGVVLSIDNEGEERVIRIPADKVEEVSAAMRTVAGLPPVWTVIKRDHDEARFASSFRALERAVAGGEVRLDVLRLAAATILAAADEVETNRPKPPAAEGSVVLFRAAAYTRMSGGYWMMAGSARHFNNEYFQDGNFTVLHDPEKNGTETNRSS